jgi:ABC-type sugar transport system, permease component
MIEMKLKDKILLRVLPLIVINVFVLVPIFWAIITAFKKEGDVLKIPIEYLPKPATLDNIKAAWAGGFSKYFINSINVSVISVFFVVILSIMIGYALSRYKFKGKMLFMGMLLAIQFVPKAALLIPLFETFNAVNLIGTHTALVVVNIAFQFPFNAVLMRGFIAGIPYSLEEAAMIDGCSRFQGVVKVVLPTLVPGIVTTAAFAFIGCWNEFLFSLMFLNSPAKYTVPIGLKMLQGEFNVNYSGVAAGALIAMSVPVLLFSYLQKYLVTGMSAGAVKG